MRRTILITILTLCFFHSVSFAQDQSMQKEFLLIRPKNPEAHGFFATFNLVLGNLHLYEMGYYSHLAGLEVDFGKGGPYYSSKEGYNWWQYYFEPLNIGSAKKAKIRLTTNKENQRAWGVRLNLTRQQAHNLIKKYIQVKASFLEKTEIFKRHHFKNFYVIGVHYRGTDKSLEAPRVPYEEALRVVLENVELIKTSHPDYRIFVATDEAAFLEYMESAFPGKIISAEAFRSEDKSNLHHSGKDPYKLGEQALMDALLLSNCHLLIRTSSHLSLWSSYYNLDLPVIMLNQRRNLPE